MKVEWKAAVAAFDVGMFPVRLAFAVIGPDWAPRIQVSVTVASVRSGLPTVIVQTVEHLPAELPDDESVGWYLFNLGLSLVEHELAEHARFQGRRLFDPHRSEIVAPAAAVA